MTDKEAIRKAIKVIIENTYDQEFELLDKLFRMYEEAEKCAE